MLQKYTANSSEAEPTGDSHAADIDASNPCSPKSPSGTDTLDCQAPTREPSRHAAETDEARDPGVDYDGDNRAEAEDAAEVVQSTTTAATACSSDGEEAASSRVGQGAGSATMIDRLRVHGAARTAHSSTHSLAVGELYLLYRCLCLV